MDFVLGLDWINKRHGWAYCRLPLDSSVEVEYGTLPTRTAPASALVNLASHIVIDAPIGLPGDKPSGAQLRPCDRGARRLIGRALESSVFPVPVAGELTEWARRVTAGEPQLRGHFRGLLPAIHSANEMVQGALASSIAESHPEMVFAFLAGHFLPKKAKKKTNEGRAIRVALLARAEVQVPGQILLDDSRLADFLDAAAMAVVARSWLQHGLCALCDDSGQPRRVSTGDKREYIMAVPSQGNGRLPARVLSEDECAGLIREGLSEMIASLKRVCGSL